MTTPKNKPEEGADRSFVVSRTVDAPRQLVWEAMTNPEHVIHWWGPRGFTTTVEKMDLRVGGVWKQVMHGPDRTNYPNEHTFIEITEPERIVYSHSGRRQGGPSVTSIATWTFEAVGDTKTKVTIHMTFPSVEARDFVVKEFKAVDGAQQTLERLAEHLPAMADTEFTISRVLPGPPELAWQAWTDPAHLARWWGPKIFTASVPCLEARVGGKYRIVMRGPDGQDYPTTGTFLEMTPPRRLVMTMDCIEHPPAWHDMVDPARGAEKNPAGIMVLTATFQAQGNRTLLTIRIKLKSREVRDNMVKMGLNQGWTLSLDRLVEEMAKP